MRTLFYFSFLLTFLFACENQTIRTMEKEKTDHKPSWALAIHGGAGTIRKESMKPGEEEAIRETLDSALIIGQQILENGGSALDAVEAAIMLMEDSPHFNAGRGAVFTHEGKNELDASIMNGKDQTAGAAGGVTIVRNPIKLARAVMEKSNHVLLSGIGAEQFAQEQGLEIVDPKYFYNEERYRGLQRILEKEEKTGYIDAEHPDFKFGTVGCVALDLNGNLAAGTSTGGMTNKRWGRIGDSPIIGAGTYADNATCAVSCTGHGEYFIRYVVAHDVHARMAYQGLSLKESTETIIQNLREKGGSGGLISVDKAGNVSLPFNSEGMYRGFARAGERYVGIYGDE